MAPLPSGVPLLDVHGHPPRDPAQIPALLAALERCDSRLLIAELGSSSAGWLHEPDVEHWRQANELCATLVRRHPDRLAAYCYVNPAHGREALEEMERRLLGQAETFVALKLWVAVRCSDRRLDPLMEFCAAHDVPVLQHTWMKVGPIGPGSANLPGESTPEDLLALARRHPTVRFFGGHVGGDWEWGVAALKQVGNVWLDVAGGEATGGYAELALRAVGASRIVFGSDVPGRSVPSQVAKLLALDLPPDDREKVLWRNAAQVLGKRFPAAWRRQPPGARAGPAAPVVLATSRAGAGCVDVNSFLGEWPSRRLNGSPPADRALVLERRIELMDRLGIERAVVSPLDAVWLKDTDVANAELYRLLDGNPQAAGRVLPAYVLNPTWPAWSEQLERCLEEYGLAAGSGAVRLLPGYHGYGLDDDAVAPCLTRLAELDLPVIVTAQLEDSRMQHPSMRVDDVPLESIAAAVRRHPTLRWIVVNLVYSQILSLAKQLPAQARVWLDIARVQGPIDCLPQLRDAPGVGAQRLLFGTNLPLHVPEAPLLELLDARYSPEDDTAIRRGNAQSLFSAAIR